MAIARKRQMTVVERPIAETDLQRATEVFLAGTAAEVTPVREIAGRTYTPGTITETLLRDYEALGRTAPEEVVRRLAA